MKPLIKYAECILKPGKSIITNSKPKTWESFSCRLTTNPNGEISKATLADIGDASLWIQSKSLELLEEASLEVKCIFKELKSVEKTIHRPKGALSTDAKLLKELKHSDSKAYTSIEQASSKILDAIGSRVITKSLDKLSSKQIESMVNNMQYKGKSLNNKQKRLLSNYINNKYVHPSQEQEAFLLYREFAQPLIEQRSREVAEQLTLSILKSRVTKGEISIEELQKHGFTKEFLERMYTENVLPLEVTKISNYTGPNGLPEFSDSQIQELYKALNIGKASDKRIVINTAGPALKEYYPMEDIEAMTKEATKASGYRTTQMNIIHCNGAKGEIQFRGDKTNKIAEYEHIAYDIREGKNTVSEIFVDYEKAISKLSDDDYNKYNKYLESWYNYYNRLELGLPAKKPQLPKGFNKVLSKENLEHLYNENHYIEQQLEAHFGAYKRLLA